MTALLEVHDLRVTYPLGSGRTVSAVNGVTFTVQTGQTLAIVGESGSGKSTLAYSMMGFVPPPGRFEGGQVIFQGRDLLKLRDRELRELRGRNICMILQNPIGSLDPVYRVGEQIVEAIRAHQKMSAAEARSLALDYMGRLGIPHPEVRFRQYPHQFSGGMSQRALIAMALACRPALLVADEPTSALDVTVQAQILDLLMEARVSYELAMVLITHDLRVAASVADDVSVMYGGRMVERGRAEDVLERPQHPYTVGLLRSVQRVGGHRAQRLPTIAGAPPDAASLPQGCKFSPRCPYAWDRCIDTDPALLNDGAGQWVACHLSANKRRQLARAWTE